MRLSLLFLLTFLLDAQTFAIIGDRTGEHVDGVYEEVWKELAAQHPAFVLSVGDTIEGEHDATAEAEWQAVETILKPYSNIMLFLTPGNHDIWSPASKKLFVEHAKQPPNYGFDRGDAHFTIVDNSRCGALSFDETAFLETDLKAHKQARWKFIVSHCPSWILDATLGNPDFPIQKLAREYGVQFVIAGHIHQMFHAEIDGVTYISMESAGGHLRNSGRYEDGWFFGYTEVALTPQKAEFTIHELQAPFGKGRVTALRDWAKAGLQRN